MTTKLDDRTWFETALDICYSGTVPVFDPNELYDTHLETEEEDACVNN